MVIKIIYLVILSIIGSCLYRLGGKGKDGFWYDFMCGTKTRDLGIPSIGILLLCLFGNISHYSVYTFVSLLFTFGFMFAAQTTYFKKKGQDAYWWNWALVGLANGLALLPYAIYTGQWFAFILRTALLIILITGWSELNDNVVWEESGRGFLIISTLGLFLKWG